MVAKRRKEQAPRVEETKRSSGLVITVLGVFFLSFMAAQWHERQKISSIHIDGATGLSRIAVQHAVDSLRGRTVKSLTLASIRNSVTTIPYVRRASVFFTGVREVTVHVDERLPVAHILLDDGSLRYVDAQGYVLPEAQERTAHNVPILRALDGTKLNAAEVSRAAALLADAHQVLDSRLYQSISEITFDRRRHTVSFVTDETIWNLGTLAHDRLVAALSDMNVFWREASTTINMATVREVDLRWHHQVVLRYHQQLAMSGGSV